MGPGDHAEHERFWVSIPRIFGALRTNSKIFSCPTLRDSWPRSSTKNVSAASSFCVYGLDGLAIGVELQNRSKRDAIGVF